MAERDVIAALNAINAKIDRTHEVLGLVNQRVDLLANTVDGIVWRNVLPLDDGFLAIFHQMGWLIVPREEYPFVVHLANGVGVHEPGTIKVLETLVRAGDTVIDVGAHIGLLSLPLARLVGRNGRVVALEPNQRSAECLRRMLVCNDLAGNQVLEVAASDENAQAEYYFGANSMLGSLLVTEGEKSVVVPAVMIDSLVPAATRIDLVKIDAEGFEAKVIAGMARTIGDNPDIFVIAEFGTPHLERYGINPEDWFETFFRTGLDCFITIDENTGRCARQSIGELAETDRTTNLLFYAHQNNRQDVMWPLMDEVRSS